MSYRCFWATAELLDFKVEDSIIQEITLKLMSLQMQIILWNEELHALNLQTHDADSSFIDEALWGIIDRLHWNNDLIVVPRCFSAFQLLWFES